MTGKFTIFFFVGLLATIGNPLSATASSLPPALETTINDLRESASGNWAYTRETRDQIGHYTERFDPSLPREQQWQLIAFDAQTPTAKHRARYAKEYQSLFDRDSPTDVDLTTLIDPDTVELVSDKDEFMEYTFQPQAEDEEDARIVKHLHGTVLVNKNPLQIRSVKIKNLRKIKPIKIVSLKTLRATMNFAPITADGPIGLIASHAFTEGRFMAVKKFSETEAVEFYDFELTVVATEK